MVKKKEKRVYMLKLSMMSLCLSEFQTAEEVVKTALSLGLKGIDWTSAAFRDDPPEFLNRISTDAGLKVVCYIPFLTKLSRGQSGGEDELKWELDRAVGVGSDKVLVPTMPIPGLRDLGEIRKRWMEVLNRTAAECAERNLIPTIENFPGEYSPVVTAEDFLAFQRQIPSLRLTFDAGNAFTGEDPVESFRRTFEFIVHMHFKDFHVRAASAPGFWRGRDGRWYRPALIGEGAIDHSRMLRAVLESGYSGWGNIEYEASDLPRETGIRRACASLRQIVSQIQPMEQERGSI